MPLASAYPYLKLPAPSKTFLALSTILSPMSFGNTLLSCTLGSVTAIELLTAEMAP